MKKVISALTAAAMCASMSASVMTAFAVYSAADTSFYLKVSDPGKGTLSEDGTTITFASAEDAKGATFTVQEFIKADASQPSVQQVGSTFQASAKGITLGTADADGAYAGVSYTAAIGDEAEYDINGVTVKTNQFMNCFAYANKLKKFKNGTGNASWGSSRNYSWAYDGPDQLTITWASDFGDTSYEDYKQTAHFAAAESDKYPFTQFDVTLDDLADGTYTVDIVDSWEHQELGTKNDTFINVDGKNKVLITNHPGITIVVGDAGATDAPTTEAPATDAPTTEAPATDAPATDATETQAPTDAPAAVDKSVQDSWTWYFDDTNYDPATGKDGNGNEGYVVITAYVTKDEGTFGYDFTPLIDGKTFPEMGFEILDISQADTGYGFSTFQVNSENGHIGSAKDTDGNVTLADGSAVLTIAVAVPETAKEGDVYNITFKDLSVGDFAEVKHTPNTVAGTLTIGSAPTPATPETTDAPATDAPATDAPATDAPATDAPATDAPTPGSDVSYLYGDVNENGKVELVDVVKLNRFLTGLDTELTAVATVNANCLREGGESDADTTTANLNGKDSVEILRYLIGLVTALPTQG